MIEKSLFQYCILNFQLNKKTPSNLPIKPIIQNAP